MHNVVVQMSAAGHLGQSRVRQAGLAFCSSSSSSFDRQANFKGGNPSRLNDLLRSLGLRSRNFFSKLDSKFNISKGIKQTTQGVQEQFLLINSRLNTKHRLKVGEEDLKRFFARFSKHAKKYFRLLVTTRFGRLLLSIGFLYALFTGFLPRLFFWFLQINLLFAFVLLPIYRLVTGKNLQFTQSQYGRQTKRPQYGQGYYANNQSQQYAQYQQQQQAYQQQRQEDMQRQQTNRDDSQVIVDASWKSIDDSKMQ
eukprot:TRINITY_DN2331_c0_g1_i7.p2 TRINITY_DN2331_c0_g1~~TRINITY_DN2331_c0_g1_i7.p2  ORF type:complete len:253 (-),score=16.62 TRINITY_DN2331_c0_g1_i7:284-1042(-)